MHDLCRPSPPPSPPHIRKPRASCAQHHAAPHPLNTLGHAAARLLCGQKHAPFTLQLTFNPQPWRTICAPPRPKHTRKPSAICAQHTTQRPPNTLVPPTAHLLCGHVQVAVTLLHACNEVPQCHGGPLALTIRVTAAAPVLNHHYCITLQRRTAHGFDVRHAPIHRACSIIQQVVTVLLLTVWNQVVNVPLPQPGCRH